MTRPVPVTRPIPGPLYRYAPPRAATHGDIAADIGSDLGWDFDADQRWSLDAIFAEDEDGLPASGEFAIIGPRQTVGKTATLECAAIADVDVFGVPLHVWTAHEFKTARKAYIDMRSRLEGHPDYRYRVDFRDSHGEEAIFFDNGNAIEFHARSGGSGRGFTTSRITLDEALFVRPGDLGALVPTGVTMPDFQVRYGSSAGKPFSEALREVRNRGRQPHADEDLAYIEFGARPKKCAQKACVHALGTPGCALEDRDLWWQANSGMWYSRVTFEAMERQRRMLSAVPEEFAREFLSWWDEPQEVLDRAVNADLWASRSDSASRCLDPICLGIEVSPQRQTSLVAAGWREDGRWHGEVIAAGKGTAWVLDVLLQVVAKVDPSALVIDSVGPAGSLITAIQAAGLEPTITTAAQRAQADRGLVDDLEADRGRIVPSPPFAAAVADATWRQMTGGGQAFDRRNVQADISSLVGLSLARHGLLTAPVKPAPSGPPRAIPPATGQGAAGIERISDLTAVSF